MKSQAGKAVAQAFGRCATELLEDSDLEAITSKLDYVFQDHHATYLECRRYSNARIAAEIVAAFELKSSVTEIRRFVEVCKELQRFDLYIPLAALFDRVVLDAECGQDPRDTKIIIYERKLKV